MDIWIKLHLLAVQMDLSNLVFCISSVFIYQPQVTPDSAKEIEIDTGPDQIL